MGIESGNKLEDLNEAWPLGTDPKSEGDNHLRLIKAAVKNDAIPKAGGVLEYPAQLMSGGADVGASNQRAWAFRILSSTATMELQAQAAAADNVGVMRVWKNTDQTFRVNVNGNVLNLNNSYGSLSDARVKTEIVDATPQLADVLAMRVVHYRLAGAEGGDPGPVQIGLVAQELQPIKPGLVEEMDGGLLTVKYSVLVPILLKAIQELEARVAALEAGAG